MEDQIHDQEGQFNNPNKYLFINTHKVFKEDINDKNSRRDNDQDGPGSAGTCA